MRQNPSFTFGGDDAVKQFVRENPWATIVSHTDDGDLPVSHYPVVVDESAEGIVLLAHMGRPDDLIHELGRHEIVVILQGPHGYISPGWYGPGPAVPTWNFVSVHLYGTPEILSDDENVRVLEALVDHFEGPLPEPRRMRGTPEDAAYAARLAKGTVGFRLRVDRFVAKNKMSQNKPPETVERIIDELSGDGPYADRTLAAWMRRTRDALQRPEPR